MATKSSEIKTRTSVGNIIQQEKNWLDRYPDIRVKQLHKILIELNVEYFRPEIEYTCKY